MNSTRAGIGVALVAALVVAFTAAPSVARPPVVGCEKSVYGSIGHWRHASGTIVAGPVGWPYFGVPQSRSFYRPHRGLAVFVKKLLIVKPQHVATIRVPAPEQSRLSVLYGKAFDPRAEWHHASWFRVSDGAAEITFKACPGGPHAAWTQFAGGFVVRGSQCAEVEIRARGSARWLRRRIAFGEGACG